MIYTYLGDWISRQKNDIKSGVDGAAEKRAAAETLKKRLELILEGEAPYDIFVRWKPRHEYKWSPEAREHWLHKLGNLALLSKRKNSEAQNYDFKKKKQSSNLKSGSNN